MSQKSKQKEKKSDVHIELQKKCEELISELLDKDNMLKKSEEKASRLGVELFEAKTEVQEMSNYIKDEFEKLHLTNDNLKSRVTELTCNKNQLQIQVATLKAKLEFERKEHDDLRKDKDKQFQDLKRHYSSELSRYELQATEYIISINEKEAMIAERAKLLEMIDEEREEYKRKLADRDRDKIQALDALKKEMKDKMKDMKSSLLSIRREQLDNNTRLTLLQNHQLIQELQYQSINTEKVVDKNAEMEKKIKQLESEIQIREQVEKQVAKRSTISKKMLKTFQEKAEALERENEELQKDKKEEDEKLKCSKETAKKMNELIKTLQTAHLRIQKLEKELAQKQSQLIILQQNKDEKQKKEEKIIELLCSYYEQTFTKENHEDDSDIRELNIEKLKDKEVKDWKDWEIKLFVEKILNHLKKVMGSCQFDINIWKKMADSKIVNLVSQNKENTIQEELKVEKKCDSDYIQSLSLEKNKLFYQNRRKLSAKNRSLTKVSSNHSISFCRYVQSNIRDWGPDVKTSVNNKSLAERFMKPIKGKLK